MPCHCLQQHCLLQQLWRVRCTTLMGGRQQSQAPSPLATVQRTTRVPSACLHATAQPPNSHPPPRHKRRQPTAQPPTPGAGSEGRLERVSLVHASGRSYFCFFLLLGARVANAYLCCCRCRATGAARYSWCGGVRAGHGAPCYAPLPRWQSCCRWCWWCCCWRMRCLCWCRAAWHGMLHAGWCCARCRALHGERPAGMCMHAKHL